MICSILVGFGWFVVLGGPADATFPGPVGRLAFVTDRDGNPNIFTMNPDGSNPARVTTDSAADTNPSWDRRGWNIFYESTRSSLDPDIYSVDDTGGAAKAIAVNPGSIDRSPVSDINGDAIIFETDRDEDSEIYTMEDNGKDPRNLTLTPAAEDVDPAVSASNKIAFASNREGNFEIHTMKLDGSDVKRRTAVPTDDEYDNLQPDWSPNNSKIAFVSDRDGSSDIFVMNSDGSDVRRLTDDAGSDLNPSWSPDGSQIAFDSDRDGNREIYVMNADGSNERRITNNGVSDSEPSWQRVNKERHAFGVDDREVDDANPRVGAGGIGGAGIAATQTAGAANVADEAEDEDDSDEPPTVVMDDTVDVEATSSRSEAKPADQTLLSVFALFAAVLAATLAFTLRPRRGGRRHSVT